MGVGWIKVETSTPGKAEVIRLSRLLSMKHEEALGAVVKFWVWADSNTVDGVVDGVAPTDVDAVLSCPGLCAALEMVGWLVVDRSKERITIPKFERHNGESAKKRALASERQARWRNARVDASAPTREEKRRTTPIPPSGEFARFWESWPKSSRKQSRGLCERLWVKEKLEASTTQIIAHVEALKASWDWRKEGGAYIPAPLVYLRQRRWEGVEIGSPTEKRMVV